MSRPKIVIKSKANNQEDQPKETEKTNQPTKIQEQSPLSDETNPVETEHTEEEASINKNRPKFLVPLVLAILGIIVASSLIYYFFFYNNNSSVETIDDFNENLDSEVIASQGNFVSYDSLYSEYEKDILSEKTDLMELLEKIGVAGADINELRKAADKKNIRNLGKGDKYAFYFENESPQLLVVEQKLNPYLKYEIDLNNLEIKQVKKTRQIKIMELAGIVESNLGITFINNNFNLKLINRLEEIFEYSVDLFSVDDGDRFKILYEQEFLDGKPYEILRIKAAYIREGNRDYYAFMNKSGNTIEYYDDYGESLKRSFLSSPIKYGGVISSGFGLRVHPIEGHEKMHFGTDYAAPEGTPIVATADGVISIQASTTNNGNYIKLRHDNTFETQYLHMQKFNTNFSQGSRVKQGDVIGYVGQTGLAKGPHVCYRFWKDKEQVDPKEHGGNVSSRIPAQNINKYLNYIKPLKSDLKKIEYF